MDIFRAGRAVWAPVALWLVGGFRRFTGATLVFVAVGSLTVAPAGCGTCSRPLDELCELDPSTCFDAEEQYGLYRYCEWAVAGGGEQGTFWYDLETGELVGADLQSDTNTCGVYGHPPEYGYCDNMCHYSPGAVTSSVPHCAEKPDWMSDAYYDGTATL